MDEPHNHYGKQQESETKEYIVHGCIYMKLRTGKPTDSDRR